MVTDHYRSAQMRAANEEERERGVLAVGQIAPPTVMRRGDVLHVAMTVSTDALEDEVLFRPSFSVEVRR